MPILESYRSNIYRVIAKYEGADFKLGHIDCCLFAADIVEAKTGIDPAKDFRDGKYRSYSGGIRLLKKAGYDNQLSWLEKHCTEKPVAFGQFGDLAVINTNNENETGYSIGVVGGSFVICLSENGLVRYPLLDAQRMFAIGEIV